MIKRLSFYILLVPLCLWWSLQGMIFDNRYLPLLYKPYIRRPCTWGHFRLQPFFMRADRGFGDFEKEGLPEIEGKYDQVDIANALVQSGRVDEDPFRSDLRGFTTIPWRREGRIDAEGLCFLYEQAIACNVSVGASLLFMALNSRQEFIVEPDCIPNLSVGDREYLFLLKSQMNDTLGVTPPLYSKTAVGDGDFYVRYGCSWDYTCKFRHIESGIKLGMYAPIAPEVPLNNPAAVPIGGNKHWGVYVDLEGDFEVKEDWHVGLLLRAIKRLPKTANHRFPTSREPNSYGSVVGRFRVNPGFTFVACIPVAFEALREGFGLGASYTLVGHLEDRFTDLRSDTSVPINRELLEKRSSWGSEHVTVSAFYDFAKFRDCRGYLPTVTAALDMPTDWIISKRSSRSYCISILLESDF